MAFYCVGNWKMNKTPEQAQAFIKQLTGAVKGGEATELAILPPALLASGVARDLKESGIAWGGQNCYFESSGAFTGENSPQIFKDLGAKFCLVGHSERRHVFGEPDEMLGKKVKTLQALDIVPILCVGETLDDRRWNRTQEVIVRQLRQGLQVADPTKPIWIAYEPVWAIGTGQVATPVQVEEAHTILRKALKEWSGQNGDRIPILYGGSVKSDNAKSLAGLANVNGFLIGGASLDPEEFLRIYRFSKDS